MENVVIKFKKLDPNAVIPSYAHNGDVGMDMTVISVEYDKKKDMYIYHTGLACELEKGYALLLFPRSSNCKTDAYLTNSVGVVDPIYRGEIQFRFKNRDRYRKSLLEWISGKIDEDRALELAPYKAGDRIGQMIILPYPKVECWEFNELSDTDRGSGGFGSTGK